MILSDAKIVLDYRIIEHGSVKIVDKYIDEIYEEVITEGDTEIINCHNQILMPGFIDLHTHGTNGVDYMNAKVEDFKIACDALYKEGVTTFLATTLTSTKEKILNAIKNIKEASKLNPSLYGIHLEGPYINKKYSGAQNPEYIRPIDLDELNEFLKAGEGAVKYITIAPEASTNTKEAIKLLRRNDVVVSAGHSDATFNDIEEAIKHGLTNLTHVHNAMSPYSHKRPGMVVAGMYFDSLYSELICDFVHVEKDVLETYYKIVGPNRFMIITDSLSPKNTKEKEFIMEGMDVVNKGNALYLKTGPLAGSVLSMDKGLRNMEELCHINLMDLARISSLNQAKSLGLKDRGEIKEGLLADLILLDKDLYVVKTIKEGKIVYKKDGN